MMYARVTSRLLSICFLLAVASAGCLKGQGRPVQPGLDVLHYDFSLTIPDTGRVIDGTATLTLRRTLPVDRILLDLIGLRVVAVWVNREAVRFKQTPGSIDIPLSKPAKTPVDTLMVAVRYGGEVNNGLIINSDAQGRWYAFGDNWPTRARCWLPTVDRPGDKATVTWNITSAADRTVIANGERIEEKLLPVSSSSVNRKLTRWSISRPIPTYLMVIAAGPLVAYDLGITARGLSEFPPGVRQSVYTVPELADYPPGPFSQAGGIVEFFASTVAPFPYEKLAHLQSFTRYGGMENASAIFYANDIFERRSQSAGIIAHETAHQWFGDAVTPQSWGHLWLSEGFASYFEQLWVQHSQGNDAFRKGMRRLRDEIINSGVTYSRPVIDTLQTDLLRLLNTNSYQKGAWTLHMVRSILGDSLFFAGIRLYYLRFRHANATSDDLCDCFEQTSHRTLRWFFDQWLRRPGVPELNIGWSYDDTLHRVTVAITQSQRSDVFRFPLSVEVRMPDGRVLTSSLEVPPQRLTTIRLPFEYSSKPIELVPDRQINLLASIHMN